MADVAMSLWIKTWMESSMVCTPGSTGSNYRRFKILEVILFF